MQKLLLLLFCTIMSLLLIPACGKENQEINFGKECIKDLYNVDINNSSVEDLEIGRGRPDEQAGAFIEHKRDLIEELGDVLGNLAVIANKYDIDLEEVFSEHKYKLSKRYCKM